VKYIVKSQFMNGEVPPALENGMTPIWKPGMTYDGDQAEKLLAEGLIEGVDEPSLPPSGDPQDPPADGDQAEPPADEPSPPAEKPLEEMSVEELRELAKAKGLDVAPNLGKKKLLAALEGAQGA
jgi:hypothetical protein